MQEQLEMLLVNVDATDGHAFASNSSVAELDGRYAFKENNSHQTKDKVELCYHGMGETQLTIRLTDPAPETDECNSDDPAGFGAAGRVRQLTCSFQQYSGLILTTNEH